MKCVEQKFSEWSIAMMGDHARIEMFHDASSQLIHLLAKTPPVKPLRVHIRRGISSEDCHWTTQWWARFIRWMTGKKWLKKMVPYPIECLANASEVTWKHIAHEIPECVQDSIYAQIANLYKDGKRVDRILVGCEALHEAGKSMHFSMLPVPFDRGDIMVRFEGFPLQLCDRLSENAVLVLEQIP